MKTIALSASICLAATVVVAQNTDYIFKAMVVSGSVLKKSPTTEVQATTGQRFTPTDAVVIQNKGYIGLLHKNGKTLEIKEPGTYQIKDLAAAIQAQSKESVGSKYATFVLGQLTKADDNDLNKNHRQYMEVTGSVERSGNAGMIKLNGPITSDVLHHNFNISWNKHKDANGYIITLTDLYNEPVLQLQTTDNHAILNLGDIKNKSSKGYLLTIKATNNPKIKSAQHLLKPVEPNKEQILLSELAEWKQYQNTASALDLVALGNFYEENHLYYDALNAYQRAAEKAPEEPAFKQLYTDMLKRIENNYALVK